MITLTFILFEITRPVVVIKVPFGLATPLMCGTALALHVSVVMVRVLFITQTLLMLLSPVVVSAQGSTRLLPRGGAITIMCPMLVIPVGTVPTSIAEGHRV